MVPPWRNTRDLLSGFIAESGGKVAKLEYTFV